MTEPVDPQTSAIVLTLDSFMMMSNELRSKIIEEANSLADKARDITVADRRKVIFCPIDSFEEVLRVSTEDSLLATLNAALDEKYTGWELREIHRNEAANMEQIELRDFPFELDGLLPWCTRFREVSEADAAGGF